MMEGMLRRGERGVERVRASRWLDVGVWVNLDALGGKEEWDATYVPALVPGALEHS